MLSGTTKSGFAYEIRDEQLNNFELVEVLAEVDKNPLLLPKLVKMLLGEEQKAKLLDHLRTADGVVPLDLISDEVMEIFQSGHAKNS